MQTKIHATLIDDPAVQTADGILRSCVHCGFCTAVCPTYQLLGDELDGPRGRIYLIKELLEHNEIASSAVTHIDRCLTCRACETACPSGVAYGQLLDIGRGMIAQLVRRRWRERIIAWSLLLVVPRPKLFGMFLRMGQMLRPLLPEAFKKTIPVKTAPRRYPMSHARNPVRRVLVLEGCVQRSATPDVNQALAYLLDLHQIEVTRLVAEGCCGALEYHLGAHKAGKARMRSLLDSLSTRLEEVDAVVSSASGCGVTIKDYPKVFENEPEYQQLARSVVAKTVDAAELLSQLDFACRGKKVAFHSPCTLQHGQRLNGIVEGILARAGFEVVPVRDSHLCCGSAGTYSMMQPTLATTLKRQKIESLTRDEPAVIATANVGCQLYLGADASIPVVHWLELMADNIRLGENPPQ